MDIAVLLLLLGSCGCDGLVTPVAAATHGRVLDASGQAVAGATVTLQARDRGRTRVVVTDAAGHFAIAELAPGVFDIRVQHPAHRTITVPTTQLPSSSDLSVRMTPR